MLIESAVVIDYKSGIAKVKCQSQSACGSCAAKASCGSSVLSELAGEQEHIFQVETITPVSIGQRVEIGLPERSLLQSVSLVYVLPLLVILLSTFIGSQLFSHELLLALFILVCTATTFIGVRFYSQKLNKKSAFQPILIRVLN
ncbi:RseC/MucC-like positive regulator of sigma(E) [Pasteurella langaaensis DSM 22999]|uniref:RseC/MucC-like positive regulator of sigma(E) n=1 Tax=Alitibacter langaaensis DSM 22999 TaxID=1122935 RepID=A0A2U0SKE6_9PAST|nr:SoxR reducing system RseC family protein [Pasteurella langaaensis]PVX31803.1 RseC/MucC-like positive regulator of sigma(E) [Pasteurella langaaensis DSM 22999]